MHNITRRFGAVLACAALLGVAAGAPSAATALPLTRSAEPVRDFWSAERMQSAVPLGGQAGVAGAGETVLGDGDELGAPWTGGGDIAKTAGRLFFTLVEDGEVVPSSCSANVVESANESVIMTAHHCAQGEDYLFVPAYDNGAMPFGGWTVKDMFTPPSNHPTNDFAAFTLDLLDGHTIEDVVGAQAISFDAPKSDRLDLFGFPRERKNDPDHPYEGKELHHSSGPTLDDNPFGLLGVGTDMGRGVSGGAFLADFDADTGRGTQIAVVSGTPCLEMDEDGACTEYAMASYGAAFNDAAKALYEQAAHA